MMMGRRFLFTKIYPQCIMKEPNEERSIALLKKATEDTENEPKQP